MKKIFGILFALALLFGMQTNVSAATCTSDEECSAPNAVCCNGTCQAAECSEPSGNTGKDAFGFGKQLDNVAGDFKGANPQQNLEQKVGSIIAIFLSFLGVIFLVLMIWSGFNWMTSGGDEEKIRKSQAMIRAAVIGLIIVAAAYALSVFIIERIWGAAN